jgi:hypothetical protein
MANEHKTQIIIAIIGLVGAIVVAVIPNLDKFGNADDTVVALNVAPSGSSSNIVEPSVGTLENPNSYQPKQFDGRVGKIFVKNTSLYEFKVTLWHPDSESIFGSWVFSGTSKKYLKRDGSAFSIGNDWGIQIGDSTIKSIGDVSSWKGNEWRISQDSFFN